MILVALAWLYVVLMVAVVEASGSEGSFLGALFTVVLYGLMPMSIVLYLMLSPARRRARRNVESAESAESTESAGSAESTVTPEAPTDADSSAGSPPDSSHHATSDPVAAVRKKK